MAKRKPFADIFRENGTDKDNPHQYGPVYDALIPDRGSVRGVLELGIWRGYSLKAWREAFPTATVAGVDVNPEHCPKVEGCEVHHCDQGDRLGLLRVVRGRQWDLIVDDASHIVADQLFSLLVLWPFLEPGGVYVIEEWDFLPSGTGPGVDPWKGCFSLLSGCELIETVDRNGKREPLVVIRKPASPL